MGLSVFGSNLRSMSGGGKFRVMSSGPSSGPTPGDPQPHRFKVLCMHRVGDAAVVKVKYPDCTNYEGVKVLVYENAKAFQMQVRGGLLDPHFLQGGGSPVARFEPTDRGWQMALDFAKTLT